jgi:hypothetical protein
MWDAVWNDLELAVVTVWPEVASIAHAVTMEKINWLQVIEAGTITPPYVVIQMAPPRESVEWGMANTVYQASPAFYYIANSEEEPNLEIKMKAMQDYVTSQNPIYFQEIQFRPGGLVTDVTELNPVAASMLDTVMPMTVGSLGFRCIFGETADVTSPPDPSLDLPAPIVFWRLEEASGSRADSVGSNDLTSTGVGFGVGHIGNAATFAAISSARLHHADAPELKFSLGSWTVALWFNLASNTQSMCLMFKGTITPEMYIAYDAGEPGISMELGGLPVYETVGLVGEIAPGDWHLVVAWFDTVAGTVSIQLDNGMPETDTAQLTINSTTGEFALGAYDNSSAYFDGSLDAVGKWDVVLTPAERTALWNGGAGREFANGAWS